MKHELLGYLLALPMLVVLATIKPLTFISLSLNVVLFTLGPVLVAFMLMRLVTWFVCGKWVLR